MTSKNSRPNPYVGPRSFRTGEKLYGRDTELNELMNLLIAERIVLLYSPSGAGKSSLVYAGLVPLLLEARFKVLPVARVNQEPPAEYAGKDGFNRYVFSAVASFDEALPEEQRLPLESLASISLADYLVRFDSLLAPQSQEKDELPPPDVEVLIFDQFEEVLTTSPTDLEGKNFFFNQLGAALRDRSRFALFAMREDYIAALDPYIRPVPTRFKNTFRLDLLGVEASLQAIKLPAMSEDVAFTDTAARKLVDDLRMVQVQRPDGVMEIQPGPYVEPVQLQVVCYRLWQNLGADDAQITVEDVASVGDVNQSLGEYYNERVAGVAEETKIGERALRVWFEEKLITESGIRSQVLMEPERSGDLENTAIRLLENSHLVRAEKRRGVTWFELAHDRLLEPVRTSNAAWFQAHLSLLQRQAWLWQKENRAEHLLLRGQALQDAETWASENISALSEEDTDFLRVCMAQRKREEDARQAAERERLLKLEAAEKVAEAERRRAEEAAQSAKKLRTRLILATVAFIAALFFAGAAAITGNQARITSNQNATLAVAAQNASTQAVGNAIIAQSNEAAAVDARMVADQQRATADAASGLALAAEDEALKQKATAEYSAKVALQQANLANSRQLASLALDFVETRSDTAMLLSIEAYRKAETSQALDSFLKAMLRNLNRELRRSNQEIPEQPISIHALAASPDGRRIAWAGNQGYLHMWDFRLQDYAWLPRYSGSMRTINVLAFSPDGKFLASADDAGIIIFWDPITGRQARIIRPELLTILALAFNPDGSMLAYAGKAAGGDINIFVRDLKTGILLGYTVKPVKTDVLSLAWSPDGRLLATGGRDRIVRIWDVASTKELVNFRGYDGPVGSLAFSPNGQWLATGANDEASPMDKNILMWDISLCDIPQDAQQDAEISPWNEALCKQQTPLAFVGQEADVTSLAFSPDGLILATGDSQGNTRLWDVLYREPLEMVPPKAGNRISAVLFSQIEDNLVLAVGSMDSFISLNNLNATDSLVSSQQGLGGAVGSLSTNAEGILHALSSDGSQTLRWEGSIDGDVEQAGELSVASPVYAARADGNTFAVLQESSTQAQIEVWSSTGGSLISIPAPLGTVTTETETSAGSTITETVSTSLGSVRSLAMSADGTRVAAGVCTERNQTLDLCSINEIHIWDAATGDPIRQILTEHSSDILSLAFSFDGLILASGGEDMAIYLYDAESGLLRGLPLIGQGAPVTTLAFSQDGARLASGSSNSLLALWDVASAQLIGDLLSGASGSITAVTFSPDGKVLVSGSDNGSLAWWRLDSWLEQGCKYALRNFDLVEWEQYFKDEEYRQTCPQWPIPQQGQ